MAYQLKTTGIAANCKMLIAVDPDTGTIKDFASSSVTADMTVGANVTINEQAWDGVTRKYWMLGSGTAAADFIAFGTNKPLWQLNAAGRTAASAVWIGELVTSSHGRMFGNGSSFYLGQIDTGAGGSTHPAAYIASNSFNGGQASAAPGKRIYGWSFTRSGNRNWYTAADTAGSMTTGSGSVGAVEDSYSLSYIARRNDSTTHNQDKVHCIAIFDAHLTEAQWDSLRDDWFGTLLEASGGAAITGSSSITLGDITTAAAGTVTSGITGASSITLGAVTTAAAGTVTGFGVITGASSITLGSVGSSAAGVLGATLTVGPFKNKSGTVLASQSVAHVVVLNATSRAVVVSLAGQTTNGSGMLSINNGTLVPGTGYMVASWNSDGSAAGNAKVTAAA